MSDSILKTEQATGVSNLLKRFAQERLIGIVRTDSDESALWTASQLLEAGVRLIEIPFTVPNAVSVIDRLSEEHPDAVIGAGTVLEAAEAVKALGAGAQFLVSPVLIPSMVQFGQEHQVLVLPGCMTPTEMFDASNLGAQAVKFFPAQSSGGADFVKAVKAPFPSLQIVPTGGISKEHVADYLKAGALAVGVGGPLIPKPLIRNRDTSGLQAHAREFLKEAQAGHF
jgi:2-dehydro-3-deoxyphosphogluconate aldolase/(4S)-4-hydroxy-2-oxoglutarate aldolase